MLWRFFIFAEPNEVDEFEDTEGIDNEQGDEPFFLAISGRVPEGKTFNGNRPDCRGYKKRDKGGHEHWAVGGVERAEFHCGGYSTMKNVMRYLGIDYGTKKLGLALSDEQGTMGFPHAILSNTPKIVDELCALIAKENVGCVVIGESRDLSGTHNPIAAAATSLGEELTTRAGVPVFYESEVFTSAEARRAPHKEEKSRAPKRYPAVDASAAALILTSYLSRTHHG